MQTTPGGIRIYGNLKPEDDLTHELGPEENFNESVYFNFFDPSQNRGGFVRMGNRANEGYAEMTVIVWNPDGSAAFNYAKPEISHNDAWDAGGLRVDVERPAELVRTRVRRRGAVSGGSRRKWQTPAKRSNPIPALHLRIDLQHEAVGPDVWSCR